jgi:23S rRNA pseudouridine1911/1915/1917 synthase
VPRINSSFTACIRNPQGDTLLSYLTRRFTYHSEAEWINLLGLGRLTLEGVTALGDERPREGQSLKFAVVDYDEPEVPLDFKVVLQTETLGLVHKPAGMPVHRTGKIFFQTLANLVREKLQDDTWSPLNRLDRETSGLVAFARGAEALREYAPAAPNTTWVKFYIAVTEGLLPTKSGSINFPLGETGLGAIRSKMDIHAEGKRALSLYRVLAEHNGKSLVALAPITGRKHQLRAHLAELGAPILGDKIYAHAGSAYLKQLDQELDEADYRVLGARNHLLHAFYLHIQKAPAEAISAFDWDFAGEFSQYFPMETLKIWSKGEGFRELVLAAEQARINPLPISS